MQSLNGEGRTDAGVDERHEDAHEALHHIESRRCAHGKRMQPDCEANPQIKFWIKPTTLETMEDMAESSLQRHVDV
jgi:hypothetical protein